MERILDLFASHEALPREQVRAELPIGSLAHVREVVARFGELGVSAIHLPAVGPWDHGVFQRLSDTVVAAFDGDAP